MPSPALPTTSSAPVPETAISAVEYSAPFAAFSEVVSA
jgi:hypothetical protein